MYKKQLSSLPIYHPVSDLILEKNWTRNLQKSRNWILNSKAPSNIINILLEFLKLNIIPVAFSYASIHNGNIVKPMIKLFGTRDQLLTITKSLPDTPIKIDNMTTFKMADIKEWTSEYVDYFLDENFFFKIIYALIPLDSKLKSNEELSARPRTIDYYNHTTHLPNNSTFSIDVLN